jgi:hypothetical protein
LTILSAVWTIAWISSFFAWNAFIVNARDVLLSQQPSSLGRLAAEGAYASSVGYDALLPFLQIWGGTLFPILIALGFLAMNRKESSHDPQLRSWVRSIVGLSAGAAIFLFTFVPFSPLRLLLYPFYVALPFLGIAGARVQNPSRSRKRTLTTSLTTVLVLLVISFGIWNVIALYPSPNTLQFNYQVTDSEVAGLRWGMMHGVSMSNVTLLTLVPTRFSDLLSSENLGPSFLSSRMSTAPFHFGYNKSDWYGNLTNTGSYLVLTSLDHDLYQQVYPKLASVRFTPADFAKIESDITLARVYDDRDLQIYFVP